MGDRRRRHATLIVGVATIAATAAGACTTGAPAGFSSGDHWAIPLIGPLEDGQLVVPVYVDGKGPYLFAIDPDANVSAVDDKVVRDAQLRSGLGPRLDDELGHQNPHYYAEILQLDIGKLNVQRKSALIVRTDAYDQDGRAIDGVLGRDVIADSLVFGFDRDAGLLVLETEAAWKKQPVGGTVVHYDLLSDRQNAQVELAPTRPGPSSMTAGGVMNGGDAMSDIDVLPISRRIAKATIDGEPFTVHLDFGAKSSQLRDRSWAAAKLAEAPANGLLVDETGTGRRVDKVGTAAEVALGGLATPNVAFVPYVEARWPAEDLEGALGLDYFRPYNTWIDWDKQDVHLVPRHPPTLPADIRARIGRWQLQELGNCQPIGCVAISVVDPLAKTPPDQRPAKHPGVVATFTRDPATAGLAYEALIFARPAGGPPLPMIVVGFSPGADHAMTRLPGEYANATLMVIDVDPFPRPCAAAAGTGCVDVLQHM